MVAKHGTIGEFDSNCEDWTSYTERLTQYFVANDVDNAAKKRAILLSICGASTYQLIRNLVAPAKPSEKTFDALVKLVKDHLHPPPAVAFQRYTFNTRKQKEGETIAEFVAELKRLSEHCKFGATLEEMPRDQLLCGVRDRRLQQKLLAESADLTWKKAFETAKALETAERNAKELQAAQVPKFATVHAVHPKPQERRSPSSPRTCYRCGGNNHHPSKCRFKDAECHYCKKRGHIVRVCRSKAQAAGRKQPRTHQLTEESQPEAEPDDDTTYSLYRTSASENKATKPIMATMLINQAEVQMEVDTGASYSVISKKNL